MYNNNSSFPVELLDKSILERHKYFSNYIILHPFLKKAVNDIVAEIGSVRSEKIVFVFGPTGVGKNELIKIVTERLVELAQQKLFSNAGCIPVVNVEASASDSRHFDLPKLWTSALKIMKEPLLDKKIKYIDEVSITPDGKRIVLSKIKKGDMREVLENALRNRESSALIFNEAHYLLRESSDDETNWEAIKSLANKSQTPIILVGTYEITRFLEDNKSLSDQDSIVEFPRYSHKVKSQVEIFQNIMIELSRHMPLEKTAEDLVIHDFMYFYKYTLGCVGLLKDWFNSAYELALNDQAVTLTKNHLEETRISGQRSMGMLKSIIDGERKMQ
jgi:Cdc6-like AAA superfamily ATPase